MRKMLSLLLVVPFLGACALFPAPLPVGTASPYGTIAGPDAPSGGEQSRAYDRCLAWREHA